MLLTYLDTTPPLTHRYPLNRIADACNLFARKADGVMNIDVALYKR